MLSFVQTSCKKLVEVDAPITSVSDKVVYGSDITATAVLTDIYTQIVTSDVSRIYLFPALSSDELALFAGISDLGYQAYYQNNLSPSIPGLVEYWSQIYARIYVANDAIEGLSLSNTLTPGVKQQLLGEAKFVRAFCYFYLVNLYGDVPLNLTTDYKLNSLRPRTDSKKVYEQIISDLKDAQSLLGIDYINASFSSTSERTRPNKFTATALLARVYLFTNDYINAEIEATSIIENKVLYDTVPLNNVFLKNSKETIWALQSVLSGTNSNTVEGRLFILPPTGPSTTYPVYLSDDLINSFEPNDERLLDWTSSMSVLSKKYNYSYKYKVGGVDAASAEYSIVFRLSEQYLIRAEARIQQGNLSKGADDLNLIRLRAGLSAIEVSTQTDLLNAILHERQVELFTEWGHRWLDLKRTSKADIILKQVKGQNWQTTDQLYPIPQSELNGNPNIKGHQNPGYN
jgi:hypothetical protein